MCSRPAPDLRSWVSSTRSFFSLFCCNRHISDGAWRGSFYSQTQVIYSLGHKTETSFPTTRLGEKLQLCATSLENDFKKIKYKKKRGRKKKKEKKRRTQQKEKLNRVLCFVALTTHQITQEGRKQCRSGSEPSRASQGALVNRPPQPRHGNKKTYSSQVGWHHQPTLARAKPTSANCTSAAWGQYANTSHSAPPPTSVSKQPKPRYSRFG